MVVRKNMRLRQIIKEILVHEFLWESYLLVTDHLNIGTVKIVINHELLESNHSQLIFEVIHKGQFVTLCVSVTAIVHFRFVFNSIVFFEILVLE